MSALKIAIAGVNGRMGRVLVEAVNNHPDTVLSGALEHSGSEVLGLDAGFASGLKTGVAISDTWMPYWLKAMSSSTLPVPSQH